MSTLMTRVNGNLVTITRVPGPANLGPWYSAEVPAFDTEYEGGAISIACYAMIDAAFDGDEETSSAVTYEIGYDPKISYLERVAGNYLRG